MSWIGWIKLVEGEMTSVLAERKIWISQTNHGKNDKKFGSTLISFLLQRKFGPPPSSSMVRLFFLYKKEHSSFRQQETNNGRGVHVKKWRTMTSTNSCVPLVLVLKRVSEWRWTHKRHNSDSTSITHQLRKTKRTKFLSVEIRRMDDLRGQIWLGKMGNMAGKIKKDLIRRKSVWIPDIWFHWQCDRIAVIYISALSLHLICIAFISWQKKKTPLNS